MTTDMGMASLIERLEQWSEEDRNLPKEIAKAVHTGVYDERLSELTMMLRRALMRSSLDAALAFTEAVLPGWSWNIRKSAFGTISAPRALLIATLRALTKDTPNRTDPAWSTTAAKDTPNAE